MASTSAQSLQAGATYKTNEEHLSSSQGYTEGAPGFFPRKLPGPGERRAGLYYNGLFIECDYPKTDIKRRMGIVSDSRQYGV